MEIQVTARPHMLFETVELLFAYVNQVPPATLTGSGVYALSAEAVREIFDTVCSGISRDDPVMEYYFGAYTLPEDAKRQTCIARHLAYEHMFMSKGSVAADCDYLRKTVAQHGLDQPIVYLEDFSARHEDPEEKSGVTLLDSIARLGLSPQYTEKLLEQFSDYERAVYRLQEIITPVAKRLEPFLTPWADRAEPLAQAWRDGLASSEAVERFLNRICFRNREQIDHLTIQLRYLRPDQGPGQVTNFDLPNIHLHMGVSIPVCGYDPDQFLPWEFEAMHLLGNPVRLQILHTLWDNPMTTRELAKALNLNLGNLCRDISNLCDCRLLVLETVKDRMRYRTNREVLKILGEHLARIGTLRLNRR